MASILISEVERDVRRLLTTLVERQGHEAVVLERGGAVPARADALLVDPVSTMSAEHVRLVRALFPDLPVVCMGPLPFELGLIGRGPVSFLPKPFAPEALEAALARTLEVCASPI
ncbi:MAG: hypothetical protein ABUS54_14055 [Actinomycetota bacterium]